MSSMSAPHTATVFHNRATRTLWLELPDGSSRILGSAATNQGRDRLLAEQRLIRTGNWLIAYGPVRSASVWTEVPA